MASLGNRIKGLFRWGVVRGTDTSDCPQLARVDDRGQEIADLEVVQPLGLYAVPRAGDGSGDCFALIAGEGSNAIVLSRADLRVHPTGGAAGITMLYQAADSGNAIKLSAAGCEITKAVSAAKTIDSADGYKKGGVAGVSGKLVIIDTGPTGPLGQVTMVIKGGIVTSVTCLPPEGGTITWTTAS